MVCPLQTVHLSLLKCIHGVMRTPPSRPLLRECGFERLQFQWLPAVGFYNASLILAQGASTANNLEGTSRLSFIPPLLTIQLSHSNPLTNQYLLLYSTLTPITTHLQVCCLFCC